MTKTNPKIQDIPSTNIQIRATVDGDQKQVSSPRRRFLILPNSRVFSFLLVSVVAAIGLSSHGEVTTKDAQGFVTSASILITAKPNEVYDKIGEISSWWDSNHTFSGDSKNLRIELIPGCCFCESFGKGDGVMHLLVIYAQRGRLLRLQGGLGPLQSLGAQGTLSVEFHEGDGGTKLSFKYTVHGRGLADWAEAVDRVLGEQFTRLKRSIELGQPEKLETREQ